LSTGEVVAKTYSYLQVQEDKIAQGLSSVASRTENM